VRKLKALEQEKIAKDLIEKNILEMCVVHRKCLLDKNDESFSREILNSFWNAIEYGLKGGKRLRGILVFASAIAASKKSFKDLSNQERKCLVDAATAIECVHAFSLVHDDLPSMDDDKIRRGRNTVHVEFGEPTALLVGDALQTLGTEILTSTSSFPKRRFNLIKALANATGASGMAGGQIVDVSAVNQTLGNKELETMHRYKTGALFEASVSMGYLAMDISDGDQVAINIREFMSKLGVAFQVIDDVLDAVGSEKLVGKEIGRDKVLKKPNFVALMGVESAKEHARELLEKALFSLVKFGEEADFLRHVANKLIKRTF
jgi:farnesyl diphosphate synthase